MPPIFCPASVAPSILTLVSLLAVGFALGLRHAMDVDHVLALATIATRTRGLRPAAMMGILWGIGHSLTVFVVGTALAVGAGELFVVGIFRLIFKRPGAR